jgi:2'-5' RNA ligase
MIVYRNPPMPGDLVLKIVDALNAAGVRFWIRGGWGVDALAGKRTRKHDDLDLIIEDKASLRAVEALEDLGFLRWYDVDSDVPLFSRIVLHDHPVAGRTVDLQPLEISAGHVDFSTGTIDGRQVPCLSLESQLATHSKYRKRRRDHTDVAILRELPPGISTPWGPSKKEAPRQSTDSTGDGASAAGHPGSGTASSSLPAIMTTPRRALRRLLRGASTVLIVPVRSVDDMRHPSALEAGMPAHVTILYPFLRTRAIDSGTERRLASIVKEMAAFDFTLSEVGRFPAVVYLAPEPAAPFIALSEAVIREWPEQQPYGGIFEEIVPHVTVAYGESTPSGVVERLPLRVRADEVWLMSRFGRRWVLSKRFGLDGSG